MGWLERCPFPKWLARTQQVRRGSCVSLRFNISHNATRMGHPCKRDWHPSSSSHARSSNQHGFHVEDGQDRKKRCEAQVPDHVWCETIRVPKVVCCWYAWHELDAFEEAQGQNHNACEQREQYVTIGDPRPVSKPQLRQWSHLVADDIEKRWHTSPAALVCECTPSLTNANRGVTHRRSSQTGTTTWTPQLPSPL